MRNFEIRETKMRNFKFHSVEYFSLFLPVLFYYEVTMTYSIVPCPSLFHSMIRRKSLVCSFVNFEKDRKLSVSLLVTELFVISFCG